jgi:thioredoxin-like negative regulator of GroEL
MAICELEMKDFDETVGVSPALIFFYTDWCHLCPPVREMLTRIEESAGEGLRFFQINYDRADELIARYMIPGIPTVMTMHGGNAPEISPGLRSEAEYAEMAKRLKSEEN